MRASIVRFGLLALAVSVCLGCTEKDPWNRQGVTGTVMFNGEPCKHGTISLLPLGKDNNTVAGGAIDNGKFNVVAKKGLAPGEYSVSISIPDPRWNSDSVGEPMNVAPMDWAQGIGHKVTIVDGPNDFQFELENREYEKKPLPSKSKE